MIVNFMPSLISHCPQPHVLPEWKVSPPNTCGSRALDFGLASLKVDCYLHPLTSPCHYIHKSQKNPDPVSAGKNQQGPDVTEIFVCLGCEALHVNQIRVCWKSHPLRQQSAFCVSPSRRRRLFIWREEGWYHINENSESKNQMKGAWKPFTHAPSVYLNSQRLQCIF